MDHSLDDMRHLMHDLFVNYWEFTVKSAMIYTEPNNRPAAEELAMTAFEQTWSCMQHHPDLVIERPQWWFKKAIDNCYQNTRRSKLQQLSWSLEQMQERRRPDTEELTFEIAALLADYLQDKQGIIQKELQHTSDGQVLIFFCRLQSNENRLQETVVQPLARSTQVEPVETALQSEDEVIRFVTTQMMKHLKGKRWHDLFITSLELLQDTRIQMNTEVPTKIVFCSVGLPVGGKKNRDQVPVLQEILATFQRENICKYAYKISAPSHQEQGPERPHAEDAYLFTPFTTARSNVNPSWLGRALKNIQVWYGGAPWKQSARHSLLFF